MDHCVAATFGNYNRNSYVVVLYILEHYHAIYRRVCHLNFMNRHVLVLRYISQQLDISLLSLDFNIILFVNMFNFILLQRIY